MHQIKWWPTSLEVAKMILLQSFIHWFNCAVHWIKWTLSQKSGRLSLYYSTYTDLAQIGIREPNLILSFQISKEVFFWKNSFQVDTHFGRKLLWAYISCWCVRIEIQMKGFCVAEWKTLFYLVANATRWLVSVIDWKP